MNTQDLIGALAADVGTPARPLWQTMTAAAFVAALGSGLAFFLLLGPRPDVLTALATPRFLLKFVETAALAVAAAGLALAMLRPAAAHRPRWLAVFAALALVATGVIVEAFLVPTTLWATRLIGTNWWHCLTLVPLLATPAFLVLLAAARSGAPVAPERTGAVIGLMAGAIGAFFYAANCTDDSPFFVATWYTIAIAVMTLIGAATGRRVLAW